MGHILDTLINMGSPFPISYALPGQGEGYTDPLKLFSDTALADKDIENFIKNYRIENISPNLVDKQHFIESQKSIIISSNARNILEELEPGVHQYIPVILQVPEDLNQYCEHLDYYYLKVCKRLQAVNIKKSSLEMKVLGEGKKNEKKSYRLDFNNLDNITLDKKIIDNHQIWRGSDFCLAQEIFLSNTLKDSWQSLGQDIRTIFCEEV